MQAKGEHRDREETQVAVLDALAGRTEEGMTVFELRSRVDIDIDRLEDALAELRADDLIEVDDAGDRTVIVPDDEAIGPGEDDEPGLLDELRRRFPF